jgi:pentatricopeptide repeat protein
MFTELMLMTFQLLLDAYGTIVPANLSALESTFEDLVADPKVKVTGVHWAALINAYGCVMKDINRAIATFESIPTHPSTARSRTPLPDAVTWEALLGALVANRRSDLLPQYIERIRASGTHITAYVANAMIRGHAAARDLDAARAVFEAMQDPPVGVAAPNNHSSPKHPDSDMLGSAPSYREPSTWEAMVRVELGAGNRDRALALLERLKERHYPQAVYARIAGIMLADDTVSPWPSSA